jgi:imidazoleglycerol-phosphate dehydratase/histidinol-phosphatase
MSKKILFIDRDGTLIVEPEDQQIDSFEKLEFLPNVISNLKKITEELDYELVMVSNQDGLGTASFPEATFHPVQNKILQILKSEGIEFAEILIDKSFPEDNLPTRKPGTALLNKYIFGNYDIANSYVIGDRLTDVQLATNLGSKSILIGQEKNDTANLTVGNWNEIYPYLKAIPRTAIVKRKTNETNIVVELNLDGNGKSEISTGIEFLNHMLEQVVKHGNIDLQVTVEGDLEIDEHHSIEDLAIALGEAFNQSLGTKKGIERYGFLLPMDDCLAQVAIDFGGRPWLIWDAVFKREKIGEMPTEMFYHFFKSFSDTAKCNLNIKAEGENEHHKIEAIFKAFAKAIKMAKTKTNQFGIPSTKGTL